MSGDTTIQALERLTHMPDSTNPAELIAAQRYYDIDFAGGVINNVAIGTDTPAPGIFTSCVADYFRPIGSGRPEDGIYLPSLNTLGFATDSELAFQVGKNPFGTAANRHISVYPGASASSGNPYFASEGTGNSVDFGYSAKSTGTARGNHYFYAGDDLILTILGTAVNATMDRSVTIEPGFSATNQFPSIRAYTTATPGSGNSPFGMLAEGTGFCGFYTRAGVDTLQMMVADAGSATIPNYVYVHGGTTGGTAIIGTNGSDSTGTLGITNVGSNSIFFYTGFSTLQAEIAHTGTAANYISLSGGVAANPAAVTLTAKGSSSNINITAVPKGTGTFNSPTFTPTGSTAPVNGMYLSGANEVSFAANSVKQVSVTAGASGGNHVKLSAAAAGGITIMGSDGADTTGQLGIVNLGQSSIFFYTGFSTLQAEITHTASATSRMQLTGGINVVTLGSAGGTNPDIAIAPSGTGLLKYGTHTALSGETVTGYITIKDAGGTTRKLAVVS